MTVDELRKTAEEYIESLKGPPCLAKQLTFQRALTPERVLALCELARVMDDVHLIAKQSPEWPGERFLNGTDDGRLVLDALAAIEAAFSQDRPNV